MKKIEQLECNEEQRTTIAVDLHQIANDSFRADLADSDETVQTVVDESTFDFLRLNSDVLGDEVRIGVGHSSSGEDSVAEEEFHFVEVVPVSRHIGRSGVVAFMREQAELAEGKDFNNLTEVERQRDAMDEALFVVSGQLAMLCGQLVELETRLGQQQAVLDAATIESDDAFTAWIKQVFPDESSKKLKPPVDIVDSNDILKREITPMPKLDLPTLEAKASMNPKIEPLHIKQVDDLKINPPFILQPLELHNKEPY